MVAVLAAQLFAVDGTAAAATWSVIDPGQGPVALPAGTTGATNLSGLAWISGDQWIAVADKGGRAYRLTVTLAPDGKIASASLGASVPLAGAVDAEGIAWNVDAGTIFVADETGPAIREHSLVDGSTSGSVALPSVFPAGVRPNLSLESLSRAPDDGALWTANEEALSVDGPVSSFLEGTLVRLQRFDSTRSPSGQWAWRTEPIAGDYGSPGRDVETSGVSDLVALPGGRLLVLERSAGSTGLQSRLFLADFTGADDTSALAALAGASFQPAAKVLRWSRGFLFENFEGAGLGPPLPGGGRSLLLVSDDGSGLQQKLLALVVHEGVCGDAFVDPPEESCDDGNSKDGDGCTAACVAEACGDGVRNRAGREECDDGNLQGGDGCAPDCRLEKPERGCRDSIRKAAAVYAKSRRKALLRCREDLNRGAALFTSTLPSVPVTDPADCATESSAAEAIARAAAKLRASVAGGAVPRCSDPLLARIAACAPTVDALVSPDGTGGCLVAAHDIAVDGMIDDEFGRRIDAAEAALRKCQETIAKFSGKFAEAREKAILGCRAALLAGRPLHFDDARTLPLLDPADCAEEAKGRAKILLAGASLRSKAVSIGGCDDAGVAELADACATTLDGLVVPSGDAGCLVTGHAAAVDALLAARP